MQLFVIVVTEEFFEDDIYSRQEWKYAMDNHILVLPLLKDAELAKRFNDECGYFHCLLLPNNKDRRDFERSLERFLKCTLISKEEVEYIRKAFDAHIFLSYRKKDKEYARELLELVHSDELLRDIAIWYDDYLIPGEDFNDAIDDSLKQCDLFALAITPRIVEKNSNGEDNFVVKIEYPLAKRYGKKIIAIEMEHTESGELKKTFADIPTPVKKDELQLLIEQLKTSLGSIALRESSDDLRHDFFIGLAYLEGIDVEVNFNRAIKLIRKAAESGLHEAVHKMASIYTNRSSGDRTEQSEWIQWLRASILIYREEWNNNENKYNKHLTERLLEEYLELMNLQKHYDHGLSAFDVFSDSIELVCKIIEDDRIFREIDLALLKKLCGSIDELMRHRNKEVKFENGEHLFGDYVNWLVSYKIMIKARDKAFGSNYFDWELIMSYIDLSERLIQLSLYSKGEDYLKEAIHLINLNLEISDVKYGFSYFHEDYSNVSILDVKQELRNYILLIELKTQAFYLYAKEAEYKSEEKMLQNCVYAIKNAELLREFPYTLGFNYDLSEIYGLMASTSNTYISEDIRKEFLEKKKEIEKSVEKHKRFIPAFDDKMLNFVNPA